MKKPIYMDFAAATPLDSEVLAAMQPYFSDKFYNPSALYLAAKSVNTDLSKARLRISRSFGVRPTEIIFTAGGSEANNLAIHGVMQQHPGAKLAVSAVEHESVLQPATSYKPIVLPVDNMGMVQLDELARLVDDQTVLVSVMYANNEVGTIQPIKRVANTLEELRKSRKNRSIELPLYFHVDACQAAQYLDMNLSRLGADLVTVNGGKLYGPKQSGLLYVKAGTKLVPQITGGGQEFGYRSGTQNVAQSVGLSVAIEKAIGMKAKEAKRLQALQAAFLHLLAERLPQAVLNGSRKQRLPNNVHITISGVDNERVIMALDEAGIQAAAGSACSASNEEPSHVLLAMGYSAADAQASLRFTMGRTTTEDDIRATVDTLVKIVV